MMWHASLVTLVGRYPPLPLQLLLEGGVPAWLLRVEGMGQRASSVVASVGGTLLCSGTMGVVMRSPVALQCYR
jgi:hypothetical protein